MGLVTVWQGAPSLVPATYMFFSDTTSAGVLGHLITAPQGWEFRLPTHPLLTWLRTGPQFFLGFLARGEQLLSKVLHLLGCPSLGPLVRQSRYLLELFSFCSHWVALFFSSKSATYEQKENPGNSPPCHSLVVKSTVGLLSPLTTSVILGLFSV